MYWPEPRRGKVPALIVVNGHGGDKFSWYAMYSGLLYARGGAAVLTFDPIGEGAYGLFPDAIALAPGATYTAHLEPGICDAAGNCTRRATEWKFTVAPEGDPGEGDTSVPMGFAGATAAASR